MIHLYAGGKFILLKSSFLIELKQETFSDRFVIPFFIHASVR